VSSESEAYAFMKKQIKKVFIFLLCSAFLVCVSSCKNADSISSVSTDEKVSRSVSTDTVVTTEDLSDIIAAAGTAEDTVTVSTQSQTSQDQTDTADSDTIIIDDKVFIAMVSDIYANTDNYIGKTIKLSGLYDITKDDKTGKTYYSVYRCDTAGCCTCGIEVDWDDNFDYPSPQQDQNVTATGVLDSYEENDQKYLVLHLSELTISDQ